MGCVFRSPRRSLRCLNVHGRFIGNGNKYNGSMNKMLVESQPPTLCAICLAIRVRKHARNQSAIRIILIFVRVSDMLLPTTRQQDLGSPTSFCFKHPADVRELFTAGNSRCLLLSSSLITVSCRGLMEANFQRCCPARELASYQIVQAGAFYPRLHFHSSCSIRAAFSSTSLSLALLSANRSHGPPSHLTAGEAQGPPALSFYESVTRDGEWPARNMWSPRLSLT
jgi:hypothetical protein